MDRGGWWGTVQVVMNTTQHLNNNNVKLVSTYLELDDLYKHGFSIFIPFTFIKKLYPETQSVIHECLDKNGSHYLEVLYIKQVLSRNGLMDTWLDSGENWRKI